MARMEIRRNNRIKLKNSKAVFLSLLQGILHKLFAYMQSSGGRTDGIACIAYMTASADIIGVQDLESENRSVFILRHPAVGLGSKKIFPGVSSRGSSCGKAMPSSTTSFQMQIIALTSAFSYCLTVIFIGISFLTFVFYFLHIHRYDQTRRLIVPFPERGAVLP